jgi:hypothetical protein
MPLVRSEHRMPVIGIDSVYFQMEDVDTGERVPCTASLETVQDRIAKAGGTKAVCDEHYLEALEVVGKDRACVW